MGRIGGSGAAQVGYGTALAAASTTAGPAVAISAGTADPALATDARGACVLRTAQGADSQAIRIEGDRVVRRLPISSSTLPLLAQAPDGLWVATEDSPRGRSAVRVHPESGAVTAHVGLDRRNLTDLVSVGNDVWVVAGDGTLTVVGERKPGIAHRPCAYPDTYPSTLKTAAAMRSSFGIAAVSRFFAYGSGTSAIPTRSTGASRSSKHALEMRAAISAVTP